MDIAASTQSVTQRFSGLSNDEQEVLDQADRFARQELLPAVAADGRRGVVAARGLRARSARPATSASRCPRNTAAPASTCSRAASCCRRSRAGTSALALSWVAHENLCLYNIYRNANEAQRRRYLPGLCNGTLIGALGLTEPGAGSDALGSMRTTATRDGDDYVLNGSKIFITNGPVADVLLVYAKTDREQGRARASRRSSSRRTSPASRSRRSS